MISQSLLYRITAFVVLMALLLVFLRLAEALLIPMVYAGLLSLFLLPLSNFLEKKIRVRSLAIFISIAFFLILFVLFLYFIVNQLSDLLSDSNYIITRIKNQFSNISKLLFEYTGIDEIQLHKWFNEEALTLLKSSFSKIESLLLGFGNFLFNVSLVMIYTFFLLMYRNKIKQFILALFESNMHPKIIDILQKIKSLVFSYLTGLLIALSIIGIMNALGLLVLGIKQGIFLGLLAGFLNIIPYIGSFVGSSIPILMALIYKDNIWYAVGVLAIFSFNQFIDNNFTTPKVVGGHVRINAFASLIAVFIGGMIWDVSGMILFIPLLGIFKICCDSIESLKPLSVLLGDEIV
jgi:predicted PurR-regulated permease PerM